MSFTLTERRFAQVLLRCEHPEFYLYLTMEGDPTESPRWFLHVEPRTGTCNVTGEPETWKGRKWRLSPHMTDGEIAQTALMATLAAVEHETREQFTYKGVSVFDPHYDIEALVDLRRSPGGGLKERT